jgi:hypothetical protein
MGTAQHTIVEHHRRTAVGVVSHCEKKKKEKKLHRQPNQP